MSICMLLLTPPFFRASSFLIFLFIHLKVFYNCDAKHSAPISLGGAEGTINWLLSEIRERSGQGNVKEVRDLVLCL